MPPKPSSSSAPRPRGTLHAFFAPKGQPAPEKPAPTTNASAAASVAQKTHASASTLASAATQSENNASDAPTLASLPASDDPKLDTKPATKRTHESSNRASEDHSSTTEASAPPAPKRRRVIDDDDDEDDEKSLKPNQLTPSSSALDAMDVDAPSSCTSDTQTGEDANSAATDRDQEEDDEEADTAASSSAPCKTTNFLANTSTPLMYADLCATFDLIAATTKRLEITSLLATFLHKVITTHPADLLSAVYLCINRLCPEYEGLELGIGESILMKAIGEATGRTLQKIKADMADVGDLGEVAMASRGSQKTMFQPKPLEVGKVFKVLKEIATITGGSSQKVKVDKIKGLMVSCRGNEAKYLVRSLEGKLRIGLAERTVLVSLSHAFVRARTSSFRKPTDEALKRADDIVKGVYMELPSYDQIVPALLQFPIDELPNWCHLTPGIPLKPMLAHPTKAISEVLDRFEGKLFTCEYKYDGERAQMHLLEDGKRCIFSRNSENLSAKYPDVLARLDKMCAKDTRSFVLDCEAVAWDTEKQCILPFQVLSTRKRKDVKEENITVQVCIFAFDLLYLNGESLLRHTLQDRRALLHAHFVPIPGQFAFAKSMESNNLDDIQVFLDESIQGNCEGLMVKTLVDESSYEPSRRSRNWLKVKKDYLDGVGDSLDLVVIGGYIGKGKRTGVYGGYLLACYDPEAEEYQAICKIGTGFSEEALATLAESLKPHVIEQPKSYYRLGDAKADVWFDAAQVWEVKTADLSISPVYQAAVGLVDSSKGISLRFPRFIRVRDDKGPEDATTGEQVADMYNRQQINSAAGAGGGGGGDDDE